MLVLQNLDTGARLEHHDHVALIQDVAGSVNLEIFLKILCIILSHGLNQLVVCYSGANVMARLWAYLGSIFHHVIGDKRLKVT